jgi:DNA-binding transcriptional regulator YiaG
MEKCPNCSGRLAASRQEQEHRVAGRSFAVTVAVTACRKCGLVLLAAKSLERGLLKVACELARRGPMAGPAFRFMRKALALSAVATAGLLDVTPETISRWENGQRPLDRGAWLTLGTLVLERAGCAPEMMQRITALRVGRPRMPPPVKIDASRAERPSGIRRTRLKSAKAQA